MYEMFGLVLTFLLSERFQAVNKSKFSAKSTFASVFGQQDRMVLHTPKVASGNTSCGNAR